MPRYYIAVPKNQKFSYQTIYRWKNYSFTGTYDEAVIKAIELFSEEGYFKDYKDKIYDFYGTDIAYRMHDAYDAWADKDFESMWKNTASYFIDYFEFESDDLDVRNWVMDFGGLKPLKQLLEDWFDHTLLLALDDPNYDDFKKLGELGLAKITEVEKTG